MDDEFLDSHYCNHYTRFDTQDYSCDKCGWVDKWEDPWTKYEKKKPKIFQEDVRICFICEKAFTFNPATCKENDAGSVCPPCTKKLVKS